MKDCLTNLKDRFQRFVNGQSTFEELTHAVCRVVLKCSNSDVIDFLSNAHRDGLLSSNHYKSLIDDISVIPQQKSKSASNHTSSISDSTKLPNELTVLNNRFVLGKIIGKGGMGLVYKARDLRKIEVNDCDDVVAIKILSSELRAQPEYLIALQREAKKAQKLAHPNIVTVYDFDRDGDIAYMTMEYLDGIPLSKVIETYAPLQRKEVLKIIRNIVRGLYYAHKHKIVHSDLKPSNIFLLKNGTLKILDFGLARAFQAPGEKSSHVITNYHLPHCAFTPAYASCEIIEHMPPTPKDDIYALGCVAHELLTGKHPYDRVYANKAKKEKLKVKRNKYLTTSDYRAISRAVELDKDKRTESVNDFLRDITGVSSNSALSSYPIKITNIAIVTLVIIVGVYAAYKLRSYETINAEQAIIVNKYEIENTLKQAGIYLKKNENIIQGENNALVLYKHILKIDPDNIEAKSGIEKLKRIYVQQIQDAIDSKELDKARELLKVVEVSFNKDIDLQYTKEKLNKVLVSDRISKLLNKAQREEAEKHYVRPESSNAYNTYLEVLELDQNETGAQQGIDRIRNTIISDAQILMLNNKLDEAESKIKDALLIHPDSIEAVSLYSKLQAQRFSQNTQVKQSNIITKSSDIVNYHSNEELLVDLMQQIPIEGLSASENRLLKLHTMKAGYFVNQGILYSVDNKNAIYYFKQILVIDPSNKHAKKGIDSAWMSLIENINRELEVNDYSVTIEGLKKLKNIFSPHYDVNTLISTLINKNEKRLTGVDRRRDITFHLTKAKMNLEAGRLTAPKGNNALESYLEARKRDPHNDEIKLGLENIEKKLSERIRKDIDQNKLSKAEKELKRALDVFPESKLLNDIKRILINIHKVTNQDLDIKKHISNLSKQALNALNRRRYIFPIGRSAYDIYSKITSIKSSNTVGLRGLNEAKLRAYDQISTDIINNNYQIAYLRIYRLTKLGITERRLRELQEKLISAEKSYKDATLDLKKHNNYLLYLLMFAKQQENKGVIWPPLSNNAFNVYKHVHDIEPLNNAAKQALDRLFTYRINTIKDLLDTRRFNKAENELQAIEKLYVSKSEKRMISSTRRELNTLKNIYILF